MNAWGSVFWRAQCQKIGLVAVERFSEIQHHVGLNAWRLQHLSLPDLNTTRLSHRFLLMSENKRYTSGNYSQTRTCFFCVLSRPASCIFIFDCTRSDKIHQISWLQKLWLTYFIAFILYGSGNIFSFLHIFSFHAHRHWAQKEKSKPEILNLGHIFESEILLLLARSSWGRPACPQWGQRSNTTTEFPLLRHINTKAQPPKSWSPRSA